MKKIRYGVIGTGWIARSFISAARLTGKFELCALYSRKEETANTFLGDLPETAAVYTDLEEMAASAIDAVYIASPNRFHFPQAKRFLEAGKHVLVEKPAAVTPKQIAALQSLARQKGLIFMEAMPTIHMPSFASFCEAVKKAGNISTLRINFSQYSSKYPAYLNGELPNIFNPAMGTGCLMDLGIYCVYPMVALFGAPKRVEAWARFLDSGADSCGTALLFYPDQTAVLTYSKIDSSVIGSEIGGDQGTVVTDSISHMTNLRFVGVDGGKTVLHTTAPKEEQMKGEAETFFALVQGGDEEKKRYRELCDLSLMTSEVLARIRKKAGIVFPAEVEQDDKA